MLDWDSRGTGSCHRGLGGVEETFCGGMEGWGVWEGEMVKWWKKY